jgi:hypothetical protein
MSLRMMLETVSKPPPPMPAKALAATSSFKDRASPQKRQPVPNIVYAERSAVFRPKMSESFP